MLFEKIDQEDDGEVYLKEVVMFLRAVNVDIDANMEVIENMNLYSSLDYNLHFR